MAESLLAKHADPNAGRLNLPLNVAASNNDMPMLVLLLSKGANPNTNTMVNWPLSIRRNYLPKGGSISPLFLAVNEHHPETVKELIRFKADPNATDISGDPFLFSVIPHTATLKALLDGGANPNVRDNSDVSPLDQAFSENNAAAFEELLAHGADANSTNRAGWSPLHAAAAHGNKAIAELLLKNGADVNAHATDGLTPLHLAAAENHPELVELLLANKADPNARNKDGYTPLDLTKNRQSGVPPPGVAVPQRTAAHIGSPLSSSFLPAAQLTPSLASIPDLLRQHGAVEDLPRLDRIEVRRPSANFSDVVFRKGTNDWNQFRSAQ